MGTFHESFEIAAGPNGPFETVEALVDTGATYTLVPAPILRRLGVEPIDYVTFIIADGSRSEQAIGEAVVRMDDRQRTTIVVFGGDDAEILLGAFTLEAFTLGVDPVNERLTRIPGFLVGLQPGSGS